jgi:hypothetical protein
MMFLILAFIAGLVYGYVKPGKEKRWELLKKGIVYGVILLAKLASENKTPSVLFNASRESNVYKFLTDDEDLFGTVIRA